MNNNEPNLLKSGGKLITFDGQHGAGKSFITKFVSDKLVSAGYSVITTNEPTNSEIGTLARNSEQCYVGKVLACLFAADRHQHCKFIMEKLSEGNIILCDRYLISALILQNMDDVEFDYTMSLNNGVVNPNLQIVLYADSKIIDERFKSKSSISRLAYQERAENYDRYQHYKTELERCVGSITYILNNSILDAENIAKYILQQLEH